jgi:NAD(P)H dehydrogenase (quinone)
VEFRAADYDDPIAMARSFEGAEQIVLISADGIDEHRLPRQLNAVRAAKDAGIGHIVFTSSSTVGKAPGLAHAEVNERTEDAIAGSGTAYTILRNNLYAELLLMFAAPAVETGVIRLPAGQGRAAMIGRSDIAVAISRVLEGDLERNRVYELTGPAAYGHADLADVLSHVTGRPVAYEPGSPETATAWLAGLLPVHDEYLPFVVDAMREFGDGWLEPVTADYRSIVGSNALPAVDVWRGAMDRLQPHSDGAP